MEWIKINSIIKLLKSRGWLIVGTVCINLYVSSNVLAAIHLDSETQQWQLQRKFVERAIKKRTDNILDLPIDIQLIPEYEQIDREIQAENTKEKIHKYFDNRKPISRQADSLFITVNSVSVYNRIIKKASLNNDLKEQGIVLLHISFTNTGSYDMVVNAEDFHLRSQGSNRYIRPNTEIYPLDYGDFNQILENTQNVIKPEQTVEGYLVYNLSSQDFESMKSLGYFGFHIRSPHIAHVQYESESSKEDEYETIYLPSNLNRSESIVNNNKFNADMMGEIWIGDKQLIAESNINDSITKEDITINLKRFEIVDISPRPYYQQFIHKGPDAPVYYSIAYEIVNDGQEKIYVDSESILSKIEVNQGKLLRELPYIKKRGLLKVLPKDKITMVEVYKTNRKDFQSLWQGNVHRFKLDLPIYRINLDNQIVKDVQTISRDIEFTDFHFLNEKFEWQTIE